MLEILCTTIFPILSTIILQDFHDKHTMFTSKVENSMDPDQLASQKPADLDLHCLHNMIDISLLSMIMVKSPCKWHLGVVSRTAEWET